MKRLIILIALMVTGLASAVGLDGRIVILLVSEHRSGDPRMEQVKAKLLETREKLGYSTDEMPIVYMGFLDSDTEKKYFDRLGFQSFDSPVLCVAEWGNPARFGPKQVVADAIARSATPDNVDYIVESYLKAIGKTVDPDIQPTPTPKPPPQVGTGVEIVTVRFEASGKPLYLTNAAVRIKNNLSETATGITIRFFIKRQQTDGWTLMGKKTIDRLPAGYFATRDIVGDTRKFNLVDENGNSVSCFYRIEVEQEGNVMFNEGKFTPSETPVGSY